MKITKIVLIGILILSVIIAYKIMDKNNFENKNSSENSINQGDISNTKSKAELNKSQLLHISTPEEFNKLVIDSEIPVVVDFYADWCGPCKMFGPVFEKSSQKWQKKVKHVKINVDTARELASKYQISGIPAILFFNNGKIEKNAAGYKNERQLEELVKKSFKI